LPFLPANVPAGSVGAMVFVLALALFAWAIITISRAGSKVPTNRPTTTIVESGPYRFTRNPIYVECRRTQISNCLIRFRRPGQPAM
jgi:protein-S-isoprenylcysteine O-methyltransferase Ste14